MRDLEKQRETQKRYKERRKIKALEQNKCITCWQDIEPERIGKLTCLECHRKRQIETKRTREFCKSMGICPRCSKNKLYGDEKTCIECRAKQAEYRANLREQEGQKEHERKIYNAWQKRTYEQRRNDGFCYKCGKRNADKGYKSCSICRGKINAKRQDKIAISGTIKERRIKEGKCVWCENLIKPSYKVCEFHYQMNISKLNHPKVIEVRQVVKDIEHQKYLRWEKANIG